MPAIQKYNHGRRRPRRRPISIAKEEWDPGTQFVIKGHNARIDVFYGHRDLDGGGHDDIFRTGVQLIF